MFIYCFPLFCSHPALGCSVCSSLSPSLYKYFFLYFVISFLISFSPFFSSFKWRECIIVYCFARTFCISKIFHSICLFRIETQDLPHQCILFYFVIIIFLNSICAWAKKKTSFGHLHFLVKLLLIIWLSYFSIIWIKWPTTRQCDSHFDRYKR